VRELNPCHKGHFTEWQHMILLATHTLVPVLKEKLQMGGEKVTLRPS